MDKNIIKRLILENQKIIQQIALVDRTYAFEPHSNYVLVGLRRVGKSYLLFQHAQELIKQGHSAEEILYFNFEDDRLGNMSVCDLDDIKLTYEEMYAHKPIFMLDEVQIVDGWEKFARRLADQKYRVFITGSNAKMLSSEISTTLGGRYIVQKVYPFSFKEYLFSKGTTIDPGWEYLPNSEIKREFNNYFHQGGLPELSTIDNPYRRQWLSNLYNKIYFGDITSRHNVRNALALKTLMRKLAESVKQPISFNRLANIVSTIQGKVKPETIVDYISYIEDACLVFPIQNIAAKLQDKVANQKYYFIDNGLLSLFLIDPETSLLENLVAVNLIEKYEDDVYFYNEKIEVDFCLYEAETGIQVSYSITEASTRDREVKALIAYGNRFPSHRLVIITMDEEEKIVADGKTIEVVPLWKWLLR